MNSPSPASARATLFRQLATATRRNIAPGPLLTILADDLRWPKRERRALAQIAQRAGGGATLPAALAQAPGLLAQETVRLLEVAAGSGQLAPVCDALAIDYADTGTLARTLRQALAWPLSVAVVAVVVLVVVCVYVLPEFDAFYGAVGAPLPGPTAGLIVLGRALPWLAAPLALALVLLVVTVRREPAASPASRWLRGLAASLPLVRDYLAHRCALRLSAWLRAFGAHPALREAALEHLRATTPDPRLRATLARLRQTLASGAPLSQALSGDPALPRAVVLFARLGETLRDPQEQFAQLGELLAAETEESFSRMQRGLVMTFYAVLTVTVGLLVTGVYLPIFHLGAAI